jgi:hypothetical protein
VPSGVGETPASLRNRPAESLRGLDPLANHAFGGGESLGVRRAVSRTARELGDLGDERLVLLAPPADRFERPVAVVVDPLTVDLVFALGLLPLGRLEVLLQGGLE